MLVVVLAPGIGVRVVNLATGAVLVPVAVAMVVYAVVFAVGPVMIARCGRGERPPHSTWCCLAPRPAPHRRTWASLEEVYALVRATAWRNGEPPIVCPYGNRGSSELIAGACPTATTPESRYYAICSVTACAASVNAKPSPTSTT